VFSELKPNQKPLIILLVKRVVLFLAFINLLLVFLYAIGTAQIFLDSTQLNLLRWASSMGLLLFIGALYGFILDIYGAIRFKSARFLLGSLAYLSLSVLGAFLATSTTAILVLVSGRSP